VNENGVAYAKPAKLGKVSSECITKVFNGVISPNSTLCTDNEKAYIQFAGEHGISLIQMDTDCRVKEIQGKDYGIQRINVYHSRLKGFLQVFRGVSTKYLENYLIWTNLLANNRRGREDILSMLFSQILTVRMTERTADIPKRPPIPCMT
jgi:transposase-like protein